MYFSRSQEGFSFHWMLASTVLDFDWTQEFQFDDGLSTFEERFASFKKTVEDLVVQYARGDPKKLCLVFWFDGEREYW